jgi:hypothetical protein
LEMNLQSAKSAMPDMVIKNVAHWDIVAAKETKILTVSPIGNLPYMEGEEMDIFVFLCGYILEIYLPSAMPDLKKDKNLY